jgi:DNA repair protein RecO (recombination protein O)
MILKDEGVVLKTARSGETSKTITLLSREGGKIRLLAKGALGEKSALRGALEPGNHIEVVYYHREGRTRYFLKEAHVHSALEIKTDSLGQVSCALAVLELLDGLCHWESPDGRILDLLIDYLRSPPAADPLLLFLVFELRLLSVLGALPDISACAVCGAPLTDGFYHPAEGMGACLRHSETTTRRIRVDADLIRFFDTLTGGSLAAFSGLTPDGSLRKRLGTVLHWTYTFHVNNYRLPESLKLIPKD